MRREMGESTDSHACPDFSAIESATRSWPGMDAHRTFAYERSGIVLPRQRARSRIEFSKDLEEDGDFSFEPIRACVRSRHVARGRRGRAGGAGEFALLAG